MNTDVKVNIYKEMIQYIIDTTNFSIKSIAILAKTNIRDIQSIYYDSQILLGFNKEINLIRLFELIIEMQSQKFKRQLSQNKENSYEQFQLKI